MKPHHLLLVVVFILCKSSYAQKTVENWYDENWVASDAKLARYYSHLDNTDSGWFRKDMYVSTMKWQMTGLYEDKDCKQKNGIFRWYYPDGSLKSFGAYEHNKKKGLHLEFFADGSLKDSAFYADGKLRGVSSGWYKNGNQEYSYSLDENGNGVYTSWFDNGLPSSAGRYKDFVQNGRWQFFHKNGKVSAVELYELGKLKENQYFSEDGTPQLDTTKIHFTAEFPGGRKAWSKFISSQLYFPSHLDLKDGTRAVLIVSATIDEDGKVVDIEVDLPLHPQMDKIAVDALKKAPMWLPEKNHNRKVASRFTQRVSFTTETYIN